MRVLVILSLLVLPALAGAGTDVTLRQGVTYHHDFCYEPAPTMALLTCETAGVRSVYTRTDVVHVQARDVAVETPKIEKTCKVPHVGDGEDAARGLFWCLGVRPAVGRAETARGGVGVLTQYEGAGIRILVLNGSVWEVIRVNR